MTGSERLRGLAAACALLVPGFASAHERFVDHRLQVELCPSYFHQINDALFGIHPDVWNVTAKVFAIIVVASLIWYLRQPLEEFILRRLVAPGGSRVQWAAHLVTSYLTDKPVKHRWFVIAREWAVVFFMRSAALVLMFSATNDSLVMPSYPLDPNTASFFKFAQVFLAILILTQTALPFVGAAIFGTWIYMFYVWGWLVAADAMPVLTVAVLYVTSPWQSHKLAINNMNAMQARWVRRVLGLGFVVLGWLKLYNHDLTAGVADNYPSAMGDPMVQFLLVGTATADFPRETWVAGFGLAEVMSGSMLMLGVFSRFWASIMIVVFTKLMLVDFGWEEIPHIYPIAAMLVVVTNNHLSSEFDVVERMEEAAGRAGRALRQGAIIGAASMVVAAVVLVPWLYLSTWRPPARNAEMSGRAEALCEASKAYGPGLVAGEVGR